MPKIPRINAGDSSAATPTAAPLAAESVAMPALGLAGLADTAFQVLSTEDKKQALEQRAALEQKQAIVNEVEAGRRAGDYEEDLATYSDNIKKEFADTPDKAPAQLLEIGRNLQDRQREAVPNTQVGLEFAQRSNARLAQAVRELHDWALARQTQKAKGDLTTTINRATAGAENMGSVPGLANYIAAKEIELTSVFQNVLGSEAQSKMAEMKAGMARSWVMAAGDRDPLGTLQALDSTKAGHPLVDNLDVSQREALRKDVKASFAGYFKNGVLEEVKRGTSQNRELFDLTMASPQNAGTALAAAENALVEQSKAAEAQMKVDTATLEKYGIDLHGHSTDEVPKLIEDRLKYVRSLNYARRTMIGLDAQDDPAAAEGAILATDKALKKRDGKDLGAIVKQQANLAVLFSDKKIGQDTFQTLFKNMALALDVAAQNNEAVTGASWGPNTWRLWYGPQKQGAVELNRQFSGQFSKLDKAMQNRVRLRYMQQFQGAQERGVVLKAEDARRMALRALSLETGEHIGGVE